MSVYMYDVPYLRAEIVATDEDVQPSEQGLAALSLFYGMIRQQDHACA